ncbi:IPT/TIG domain-containing protein [Solwaraspora sp. WMMD1047]|uniref:phage tail tube protein n=1 Tax=Solwaraspora sp. WMMD1047 TaxID=3016102 RepID=UPI002415FD51|nr:IPT/TIG domain-containing protein [Solwaraspora sp. WMMD1047]MDG4832430.1 IPT/TIG domain-containing protein [Solwaraspora sp. WMMD1047]
MTQPTDHVTLLARRMAIDIDIAAFPAVDWERLLGVEEMKPIDEPRVESDEAYDDEGAMREVFTGYRWAYEIKLLHRTAADGVTVNPVHAFLKAKFKAMKTSGTAAGEFGVRVYDRAGLEQAEQGRAYVKSWNPDGGGPGARDTISLVIQGQGPMSLVDNPAADLTPVVLSLTPATGEEEGGELITIGGQHFTGATDVDFGVAAADFTVIDDSTIVAVAPVVSPGTVQVTVTTPEGTSSTSGTGNDYVYTT